MQPDRGQSHGAHGARHEQAQRGIRRGEERCGGHADQAQVPDVLAAIQRVVQTEPAQAPGRADGAGRVPSRQRKCQQRRQAVANAHRRCRQRDGGPHMGPPAKQCGQRDAGRQPHPAGLRVDSRHRAAQQRRQAIDERDQCDSAGPCEGQRRRRNQPGKCQAQSGHRRAWKFGIECNALPLI